MTTLTANINTATSVLSNKVFPIISWKSISIISLFLASWFCAFAVVYTTYSTRHAFAELQNVRQQHDTLFMEWTQLLLEQSALTDTGQIEQIAWEEFGMQLPTKEQSHFLVVQK